MNKELEMLVSEVNRLQDLIAQYPPEEAAEALSKISFRQFALGMDNAAQRGKLITQ